MGLFSKLTDNKVEMTISNKTILRVVGLVFGSILFLAFLGKAAHALTLIFIAFFLAIALNAPVHWLAEHLPGAKKGSRVVATATSFLIVIAILAAFFISLVPPLVRQTGSFIDAAPGLVDDFRDENTAVGSFIKRYNLEEQLDKFQGEVSDWAGEATTGAVGTVGRVGSSIVSVLTVLVLTFMMLIEGPHWFALGKRFIDDGKEDYFNKITNDMYRVVKGYVNGQVILAAVAAIMIAPPLFILDIGYPVALMVLVFIFGLIPMIGHTIGAIVVSLVALFTSPWAALIILAYYITYQQIENYAVQPRVQANTTDMSPLLVFASVVIGINVGGVLGGLVAIPVAGCLRIVVLDYLERNNYLKKNKASQD